MTTSRFAVRFGYIGENYQGLQRNPGARTIEDALEQALFAAGGIEAANHDSLAKVGWNRAARTDKGVHAAGNVVSLNLVLAPGDSADALRERANAALAPDVRVLDIVRVTKQFNSKNLCSGRRYGYVLPTFVLARSARLDGPAAAYVAKVAPQQQRAAAGRVAGAGAGAGAGADAGAAACPPADGTASGLTQVVSPFSCL